MRNRRAGDCTARRRPTGAWCARSRQNATEQGAAPPPRAGPGQPFTGTPWFWSDQYDKKLVMAGSMLAPTGLSMGDVAGARPLRGETPAAVDTINAPREHLLARNLDAGGADRAGADSDVRSWPAW